MADPFGIIGVIGVAGQIIRMSIQIGLDWKDAPADARSFISELQTLKTVLSETNTNIALNPDFVDAFQGGHSTILSQLTDETRATDTRVMISACRTELESLLSDLRKQAQGHRVGWERVKGAFLAKKTRDAVETLHRQCQTLNSLISIDTVRIGASILKEVRGGRKEQLDREAATQQGAVLDWLTSIDYTRQQSDFIRRRQAGTGQWLLDSPKFEAWLQTDKQTLFCPGIPGAGKTILTSIAIDELTTRFQHDNSIGIAYLYCDFRTQNEQKAEDLLASLLRQLAQSRSSLPKSLKSLYDKYKDKQTQPLLEDISNALQSVAAEYSRVFIIVDALDECQTSDGCRTRLLQELFSLQANCRANIFATSRLMPEIADKFDKTTTLKIRATDEDVQSYLDGHMSQLPAFVRRSSELQNEIKVSIVNAVDGMFLLAQLHLDSLKGKKAPRVIRDALKNLATGPGAYDHAYNDAMERIGGQLKDEEELAKQTLSWITCAKRPLTTSELRHALAVEVGKSELDEDNLTDIEDLISVCAGLVTVDEGSTIIRLVHLTAQEYFERTWTSWFHNAQREIATTCVTYLSFKEFEKGPCHSDPDMKSRLYRHPLLEYAARHWGDHARDSSDEGIKELALGFLRHPSKLICSSQVMHLPKYRYSGYSQNFPKDVSRLRIAAAFGMEDIVQQLLLEDQDVNEVDDYGWTALQWAAENGHEAVAKLLVEKGVDVNKQDGFGRTALHFAARRGHDAVVKLLVEKGAEVKIKDESGQTAAHEATRNGHKAIEQLLVQEEPDVSTKDDDGLIALHEAAASGNEALVFLLVEQGAAVNEKTKDGRTALHFAAHSGHEAVVRLLVEKGADVKIKSKNRETPLHKAAQNGHEVVVQLLVDKGANVNAKIGRGGTALHLAARNGHEAVVRLLVEKGTNIYAKDKDSRVALEWAAWQGGQAVTDLLDRYKREHSYRRETELHTAAASGHEAYTKLLVGRGHDVNMQDKDGQTALHRAAASGNEGVVRLLMENGANINAMSDNGSRPLHIAAMNGHQAVVQLLVEKGADVNMEDQDGSTALHEAARSGNEAMVQLLVESGAGVNLQNEYELTALHEAARSGNEAVVQLLMKNAANINVMSDNGSRALREAAGSGNMAVVRLLIENGANINAMSDKGSRALREAAGSGNEAVAKLLVENGADVNGFGATTLLEAVHSGNEAVVRLLVENGADVNAKDKSGWRGYTALHGAAARGNETLVRLLVKNGADVNAKTWDGHTALHQAVGSGNEAIVRLLEEKGADVSVKDTDGRA